VKLNKREVLSALPQARNPSVLQLPVRQLATYIVHDGIAPLIRSPGQTGRAVVTSLQVPLPLPSNISFTMSVRDLPMWKSRSILSAALAALLLLGLPILAGGRLPAALAQVSVSFKEWPVPTKGSHPHDPLAAADGSLWYTGQMASTLGRLDPETGVFKEYRTNVPNSGPHGLVADQDGNIWFTASFAGYIGKLDPNTGAITEYRLPADARDPHTPVFDQAGNLWFTVIGANAIGRLVPKTGEIRIVHVPTKNALPYGIAVSSDGIPYFAEFGTNKLASISPDTVDISEYLLPDAATRPRRIAITSDGAIWYTDYARGFLGRFDPKTGSARDWPSPSGPGSGPYGIAALGDVIWYSESGVSPNTLARFDPRKPKIEIWPIPSGGGVVRNMTTTRDGKLVLACSGVDRIALVDVR